MEMTFWYTLVNGAGYTLVNGVRYTLATLMVQWGGGPGNQFFFVVLYRKSVYRFDKLETTHRLWKGFWNLLYRFDKLHITSRWPKIGFQVRFWLLQSCLKILFTGMIYYTSLLCHQEAVWKFSLSVLQTLNHSQNHQNSFSKFGL